MNYVVSMADKMHRERETRIRQVTDLACTKFKAEMVKDELHGIHWDDMEIAAHWHASICWANAQLDRRVVARVGE